MRTSSSGSVAESDCAKWEQRYRAGSHPGRAPEPLVVEAARLAGGGRALDIACGRGRHAIFLALQGFSVDAIDISPTALASARERAEGLAVRWIEADLDETDLKRTDLKNTAMKQAGLETGAYALVACVDFTDAALVPRLVAALAPGGLLAYVARPRALCSFGPQPGQVVRWFGDLERLAHRESDERVEFLGRLA